MEDLWMYVLFLVLVLPISLWLHHRGKKEVNLIDQATKATKCRMRYETLYIEKRSKLAEHLFEISVNKISLASYTPEEIHVGAVSVGGVTTGGVYKTGGTSVSSTYGQRCKLMLRCANTKTELTHTCEVREIVLTDALTAAAKNSPISKYLNGNKIMVVDDVASDAAASLLRMGQKHDAANVYAYADDNAHPTAEKCREIIRWLSTES